MAERSNDARDSDAARSLPDKSDPPKPPTRDERSREPADEAEKARTEIAAGDVADDLADFA